MSKAIGVQLQQVMLNLIVNAIQAMSGILEGARELQISIDAVPSEGSVRVGVRDTGPGLNPGSLLRLFEPFYTTKPEGMGMGLSICRSIIEANGGRLWATPCDPQGALFQFNRRHDGARRRSGASVEGRRKAAERARSAGPQDTGQAIASAQRAAGVKLGPNRAGRVSAGLSFFQQRVEKPLFSRTSDVFNRPKKRLDISRVVLPLPNKIKAMAWLIGILRSLTHLGFLPVCLTV